MRPGAEREYLSFIEEHRLPIWREMHKRGDVASLETIRLTRDLKRDEGVPDWNLLQVGCVPEHGNGAAFFELERAMVDELFARQPSLREEQASLASILRCESLRTTPNSHSPQPIDSVRERYNDTLLSVECIRVQPEALEHYQELMIRNAGPASREMHDEGFTFSFIPLETEHVILETEGMPGWNQLHVLALLPEHTDDFIGRFSEAITRANPESGGYDGYFGELDGMRDRPRWSVGRYVASLRIG
ncbi:MAG: hypothetical protein HYR72_24095 [Deltaproteobacteria bacterium]|nr:hypothetical protein [Deltaproteobacteria bacterium]MBI3389184.1 hypothetical protein [Deltaproteobacteria bacterium]